MARLTKRERRKKANREALIAVLCFMNVVNSVIQLYMLIKDLIAERRRRRIRNPPLYAQPDIYQKQVDNLNALTRRSDTHCHEQLRVNRHVFFRLCLLLRQRGLEGTRNVTVEERVAIFLWIIGHHTKQRRTTCQFYRSTETISRHFNVVLLAVLCLYDVLWYRPQPIPANEPDARWRWFEVHIRKCY